MSNDKITQCVEALERLIKGETINVEPDSYDEITYGLIEREAGTVSKGYIKHAREAFKPIVDRLNAYKLENNNKSSSHGKSLLQQKVEELQRDKEHDKRKIKELERKLHIMMADNLKLVERGRELEQENLKLSSGKIIKVPMGKQH